MKKATDGLNLNLKNCLWASALLLVVLAWIFGLFIDLTGDSGLYAAISRQMVESGNWLNLKINGEPYDQKPHLFFWLAGTGIRLFGNTNFAYKLFLFLFGVAGIYFTYRLAKLLYSETAGKLAALFAGTSQLFFLYFFDIHTDTVLQSAVILSLWQLAAYLKHRSRANFMFAFLGIGLAMLTKGPVGGVLPFFFVLIYLLLKKDYRQLFQLKWFAGIALVLLIISPTLFHLWKSFGAGGLRFYFIDNNLGRVSGAVAGSSTDPFYYLYNLLWAFLPWTVPVMAGLAAEVKTWVKKNNLNLFSTALLGSVLILLFVYSIARGKAPNYLMMLMPPMAVVAAGRIERFRQWKGMLRKGMIYSQIVLLAVMVLIIGLSWYTVIQKTGTGLLLSLVVASVLFILVFIRIEKNAVNRLLFISLLISANLNFFLNTRVIPELFSYQGSRQVTGLFMQYAEEGQRLYNWDLEEYQLFFMAEDSVRNIASWKQMHEVMEKPGTWLYTNEWKHDEIVKMGFPIDTVYRIEQRGMNAVSPGFLNFRTRQNALEPNFLIKTKDKLDD